MNRPSWEEYFKNIVIETKKSPCKTSSRIFS